MKKKKKKSRQGKYERKEERKSNDDLCRKKESQQASKKEWMNEVKRKENYPPSLKCKYKENEDIVRLNEDIKEIKKNGWKKERRENILSDE